MSSHHTGPCVSGMGLLVSRLARGGLLLATSAASSHLFLVCESFWSSKAVSLALDDGSFDVVGPRTPATHTLRHVRLAFIPGLLKPPLQCQLLASVLCLLRDMRVCCFLNSTSSFFSASRHWHSIASKTGILSGFLLDQVSE